MDPCPCLETDLELPELPNTPPLFIPTLSFLHMWGRGGNGEGPYNALSFIYWCMRKTQENCGLRGFVKRLETLSLPLFSLVHLYPLVGCLSFHISRVVAYYYSLDDHLEFPCYFIMCNHN